MYSADANDVLPTTLHYECLFTQEMRWRAYFAYAVSRLGTEWKIEEIVALHSRLDVLRPRGFDLTAAIACSILVRIRYCRSHYGRNEMFAERQKAVQMTQTYSFAF